MYSQSGQVFYEAISKKYPETKENKADVYIVELENTKILLKLKFNNTVIRMMPSAPCRDLPSSTSMSLTPLPNASKPS